MNNIITEDKSIRINDSLIPKNSRQVTLLNKGVRLSNVNKNKSLDLFENETTIDGELVTYREEMFEYFKEHGFTVFNSTEPPTPQPLPFIRPSTVSNRIGEDNIFNSRSADVIVIRNASMQTITIDLENGNMYAPYEIYTPVSVTVNFINIPLYFSYNKNKSRENIDKTQPYVLPENSLIKVVQYDAHYSITLLEIY